MSSVIYGSVIDGGPARTRRCSSKKGYSTTKDTKEHEEKQCVCEDYNGHRAQPEGDCMTMKVHGTTSCPSWFDCRI